TNMNDQELRQHLAAHLDKWQGYVGINNHMGSKFTSDAVRMGVVMEELKARGLMWLDSKTTADSAGPLAAAAANVPYLERDVFLDNVDSVSAVLEQLAVLQKTAKSRGFAIGIGHPHDGTIDALKQWLPTLRRSGISLVPITEILKRREDMQRTSAG
ncbi:MAG: divergent polysaccharide deacetylase family protein, partial [Alphaproteobacteria bacterium]